MEITTQDTLDRAKIDSSKKSLEQYYNLSSAFNLFASGINYNVLQGNFDALTTNAEAIEVQAQQRANQLRDNFISNLGEYKYTATKRGIKTSSGSVKANIEGSAKDLGIDIERTKKTAKTKADIQRKKAGLYQSMQTGTLLSDIGKSIYYGAKANA